MQHLTYLRTGTPRLYRVVNSNNHQSIFSNRNILTSKRHLSNISNDKKNKNDIGINTELYKSSTSKKETHVPDDLKGGQSKSTATLTGDGKVWSVQNPGSVHVAPLGAGSTTFVPTSHGDGKTPHEKTVHATQGELNIADPLTTHILHGEPSPGELAGAAAASAFETFAPDTPLTGDSVFSPKVYTTDHSPTSLFENITASSTHEKPKYETSNQSKIFGGQNTLAKTKTHQNKSLYNTTKTKQENFETNEIPIQRESDIRDDILRESLKYVNEKGWTMEAIRAGVRASNQPTTIEGLFSNGYDLVEYFMRDANSKMSVYMDEKSKKGDAQGSRLLVDGLKYRLGLVIPYANTWDQVLAQGALPQNAMRSWKNLLDLSGDAWNGIGDTSTDINWYSKRLLLAAVYKSAEIYMLQDQSLEKIDTMNFLERRLNDFQTIGSVRNTVSKSLSDTAQIASGLFSVVRNLTSRR